MELKDEERWGKVQETIENKCGGVDKLELGRYYDYMLRNDIKHLGFTLSRYKFVSKLMKFKDNLEILELGCQEAVGALMFEQNNHLKRYVGVDLDEESIVWNKKNLSQKFEFVKGNFFEGSMISGEYDLVFNLDVIEHVERKLEDEFMKVLTTHMRKDGTCIIGTPSIYMNEYASEPSRIAHINLYSQQRLYGLMKKYLSTVYIFNMNDEIVNVGFDPMSCYIFAVGSGII